MTNPDKTRRLALYLACKAAPRFASGTPAAVIVSYAQAFENYLTGTDNIIATEDEKGVNIPPAETGNETTPDIPAE